MVKALRTGTKPDFSQCFHLHHTLLTSTSQIRHASLTQEATNNVASDREAHVVRHSTEDEGFDRKANVVRNGTDVEGFKREAHIVNNREGNEDFNNEANVVRHGTDVEGFKREVHVADNRAEDDDFNSEANVVSQGAEDEDFTLCSYCDDDNVSGKDRTPTPVGASGTDHTDEKRVNDSEATGRGTEPSESLFEDRISLTSFENHWKYEVINQNDELPEIQDTYSLHTYHHERRRSSNGGPFTSGHLDYPSILTSYVKEQIGPCVGKVLVNKKFKGTCLAVGEPEHPCIVTCYHVLEEELETSTHDLKNVTVQFSDLHRLDVNSMKASLQYDYAIMALETDKGLTLPPTWRKFGRLSQTELPLHLVGFQKGNLHVDESAVSLNDDPFQLVDRAQKIIGGYSDLLNNKCNSIFPGKTLVQSSMSHGGSGGVGVSVDNDELRVVLMLQRGFPNEYYKDMDLRQKKAFKSEYLTEQAMTFSEIHNDVSAIDKFRSQKCYYMSADILFNGICI